MPTFTIYVLGDADSFYATLNGVAMIFGQTGMLNSAFMVGGLVMLISGILFMIGRQSDGTVPGVMGLVSGIFGLLAIVFTSTIGTTVTVTDIYSGNTVQVDNVPLLLSLPASAFTTASYKIFQVSSTAFSGVNGSYMGLGQEGFVMPLKLLNSLRDGFDSQAPETSASLKEYILDCVPGSTTFSMTAMGQSADTLTYLLQNGRPNGITTYWPPGGVNGNSPVASSGQAVSCAQDAQQIYMDMYDNFLSGTNVNFNALLNGNIEDKNPGGATPDGGYTKSDVTQAISAVIPQTFMISQNSDQFMSNALIYNTMTNAFSCMSSNQDEASFDACEMTMTQAIEQSRTDAAGGASVFLKMMIPGMIFMQLMFFGFAPLIVIFGVMRGGGALGLFVKYLLFGIWTSSWLPFAGIIQMYIQTDIADKLVQIENATKAQGLSMNNFTGVYYDLLATRLQLASDMLAATPVISLGLLTGSMMAMTSVANRMTSREHVATDIETPDIMTNKGVSSVTAAATGDVQSGLLKNGAASLPSFNLAQVADQSVTSANQHMQSAAAGATQAYENAVSFMQTHSSGFKNAASDVSGMSKSYSDRVNQTQRTADSTMNTLGFSQEERSSFQTSMNASGGFSSPFGGVNASAQAAEAATKGRVSADQFRHAMETSMGTDQSWSDDMQKRVENSFQSYSGSDSQSANSARSSVGKSFAELQQAQKSFQTADALRSSAGMGYNVDGKDLGARLLNNRPDARMELDSMHDQLVSSDSAYASKYAATQNQVAAAGVVVGGDEVAKMIAMQSTPAGMATAASVLSKLSGVNGPQSFNANRNRGVGAAADDKAKFLATARGSQQRPQGAVSNVPDSSSQAARLAALNNASPLPHQDQKQAIEQATHGTPAAVNASKHGLQSQGAPVVDAEQVHSAFDNLPHTVANSFTGGGRAYDDFHEAHPVLAAGIEVALTVAPMAMGGGEAMLAIKGAQEAVVASRAALSAMDAGFGVERSAALLGGAKRVVDADKIASMGYKSSSEFLDHYQTAQEAVITAEKGVVSAAKQGAMKGGLTAAKNSGGIAMLETAKLEAHIHRQELAVGHDMAQLRKDNSEPAVAAAGPM